MPKIKETTMEERYDKEVERIEMLYGNKVLGSALLFDFFIQELARREEEIKEMVSNIRVPARARSLDWRHGYEQAKKDIIAHLSSPK